MFSSSLNPYNFVVVTILFTGIIAALLTVGYLKTEVCNNAVDGSVISWNVFAPLFASWMNLPNLEKTRLCLYASEVTRQYYIYYLIASTGAINIIHVRI